MGIRISAVEYAKLKRGSAMAGSTWIAGGKLGPLGDAVIKKGRRYMIDPEKADGYLEVSVKMTNHRLFDIEEDPSHALGNDPVTQADPVPPPSSGNGDKKPDRYREASTWKTQYEALLRRQEYEIKSGKYALVDEVRNAFFNKARIARDAMLNIPPRVGRIAAAEAYQAILNQLQESFGDEIPEMLLDTLQDCLVKRMELLMKTEIEQALREVTE